MACLKHGKQKSKTFLCMVEEEGIRHFPERKSEKKIKALLQAAGIFATALTCEEREGRK